MFIHSDPSISMLVLCMQTSFEIAICRAICLGRIASRKDTNSVVDLNTSFAALCIRMANPLSLSAFPWMRAALGFYRRGLSQFHSHCTQSGSAYHTVWLSAISCLSGMGSLVRDFPSLFFSMEHAMKVFDVVWVPSPFTRER